MDRFLFENEDIYSQLAVIRKMWGVRDVTVYEVVCLCCRFTREYVKEDVFARSRTYPIRTPFIKTSVYASFLSVDGMRKKPYTF